MKALLSLMTILVCFIPLSNAMATDTTSNRIAAVLVQLRSENNRITALSKADKLTLLATAQKDANGAKAAMIQDFTDHFKERQVYYYIDTNYNKVISKDFDGVLLNADGTPAKNLVINKNSSNYLIVFYGTAIFQAPGEGVITDSSRYINDMNRPQGRGLVVCNDKMQQKEFYYKFGYEENLIKIFSNRKYYYSSKKFEIEYFPFAKQLNNAFKKSKSKE